MIIIHFRQTVKEYIEAEKCPGREVSKPERCPKCGLKETLIRWGRYVRLVMRGEEKNEIEIQRMRCKECGKTHALLPDFLHPYRRYTLEIMQRVIWQYVLVGLGYGRIMDEILGEGPGCQETVREWVRSFGYGAGYLLLDAMRRFVMKMYPESDVKERASLELERNSRAEELKKSYYFCKWGEILYAHHKDVEAKIIFSEEGFFPYLLHWLQRQSIPARLFWSPRLRTSPTAPI